MVHLQRELFTVHGVRRHFRMEFQRTPNGCLTIWMILALRVVKITTTLHGRGRLTLRFSG